MPSNAVSLERLSIFTYLGFTWNSYEQIFTDVECYEPQKSFVHKALLRCVPAVMAAMAGKLKRPPREDPEAFAAWCEGVLALEKAAEEEETTAPCLIFQQPFCGANVPEP